jgi:hypothetical protein
VDIFEGLSIGLYQLEDEEKIQSKVYACIGQKSLLTDSIFELKRNDSGKIPSSIGPENFYE